MTVPTFAVGKLVRAADLQALADEITTGGAGVAAEATARAAGDATNAAAISTHAARVNNPHAVTAAQVGAYTTAATDTLLAAKASGTSDTSNGGSGFLTAPNDLSAQFGWANQPRAVNRWMAVGGQANVSATLLTQGTDTNVSGNFAAQGTGAFNFGNTSGQLFAVLDPAGYVFSYPTAKPSATISGAVTFGVATVVGSDAPIAIVPAGAAGVGIGQGHTVSNTGAYAAGRFCIVTGFGAGAVGNVSQAAGSFSFVSGANGYDNAITGKRVHSTAILGSARGTTQIAEHSLACATSGAASAVATASGGASNSFNGLQLIANQTISCRITVTARDTSNGARASWYITALFNRGGTAASTTLDGSSGTGAPTFSTGTGASSWTVAVTADTTNGSGAITCTGAVGNTVRWAVRVDNSEVANG